ncbi:tyrosine-protein kinase PR2-like [Tropilaelaps mercedesae]|uniref:non-specific protein-tyrosine kinase n=1 Tax=Tropilaelaps mercedesae TaxID=418985 RepID=A0A1V9X3H7_9ACAR|nr:tyrosine-protein kinase PR2-like [Tropilaelaps mercedesae]
MRLSDTHTITTVKLMVTMNSTDPSPTLYELLMEAELAEYYESLRAGVLGLQVCSPEQLKLLDERHLRELGMTKTEQRRLRRQVDKHFSNIGYFRKIRQFLMGKQLTPSDRGSSSEFEGVIGENELIRSSGSQQHLIPRSHIILSEQLGAGEFGVVRQGVWANQQHRLHVAVKCLACERLHSNAHDFLKEAAIMHGISHPNIVKLYGVVHSEQELLLVTELAPFRSLLECLKEPGLAMHFCPLTLCNFGHQIAKGMAYLENRRMIHRDLAARNVLVFARDLVKISDFGLSRALGVGKDYYQTNFNANLKLPIAWCAPESINFLKFTSASDAWAFGVTLWELFSFGQQPWREYSGHQILAAIDEPNCQRLQMPDACPRDIYAIMLKCWAHEPSHRPSFIQLVDFLARSFPDQVQARCSFQNVPRPHRDALRFQQGDLIIVLDKSTPELWKGFCHRTVGYFRASATAPYLELSKQRSPSLERVEGSGRQAKPKLRRPQRDSSSDMTPLLRQSLTEDTANTPPFNQLNAPTSVETAPTTQTAWPSVRHEYHEISDDDLSPFDMGPPLCDDVFRGLEETETGTPGAKAVGNSWQVKEGSTSSASTVMDTRPLIKNRSPGHIVKPISPTDEQALDTAIHMAKEMASRTLQQEQQSSPLATPTRKHNGPRFFIFNTKSSHHDKKHFSEMLDNSKPLQDALPREVNDVYSALVEKGEIGCSLDESPPMDRVSGSLSVLPSVVAEDLPPPLPPKPKVAVANPANLRHHRRIHPLVLPGYERSDPNNNSAIGSPPEQKDLEINGLSQTLPRLRFSPGIFGPANLPNLCTRSSESLPRTLKCFGSSESLPCSPEAHLLGQESLTGAPQLICGIRPISRSSVPDVGTAGDVIESVTDYSELGAKPKKKLDRHVSCEDLLDFSSHRAAAKRTQGRARGVDSDEVHIMQKVLANENLPAEDCLDALNVAEWNVHKAIKLARLRRLLARGEAPLGKIPFTQTKAVLETTGWNLEQAVRAIMGIV